MPPETVEETDPFIPPLHVTLMGDKIIKRGNDCVRFVVPVAIQLFASVTVTL